MQKPEKPEPNPSPADDEEYFYTSRITLRNGRVLYAHECGKKAFRIKKRRDYRRGEK